ncbi:MAG: hypothetical protein CFH16_01077 [Alphaproteobacteria bacterium MarineAlpha5_Bin6]|nr:MAG: hypothetical protein CFH17_00365 [Alphaproteobacteria bacterium MarineAlpha5_Bin7]PPR53308.1 MAG: hypothetical protein CFH16_01077 [Alphaproteobacteria bacterium MarineAlpha5_Bin6]
MKLPLMPKATAVWLIENTTLSFTQISEFCGLHELEVQGIADGDVAIGMQGYDPIDNNQLTRDEIKRCEQDNNARLELISSEIIESLPPRKKDTKYTPISLRQEKPHAILWLIKRYPVELTDSQIAKLTGSTKNTVVAIRNGTYREAIFESKSPMDIGLCTFKELEKSLNRSKKKINNDEEAKAKN